MSTITREQLIEDLKASTQNSSGMFEIGEETICALMSLLTTPPSPVSVPDFGALTKCIVQRLVDYGAADDDAIASAEEFVYNACRAAILQGADRKPELTVWYGSMPESNGKANWTAILHRKGEGRCMDGFTIDRSEYPGRVLYSADRVRYLIGEKSERPSILDYDADAHSGYVKPGNSPVIPDWQTQAEKMAELYGSSFVLFRNGESPQCADPTKVIISFTDEGLGHGAEAHFREIVNSSTNNFRENAETSTKCWCRTCRPVTISDMRFVVCPGCGNKRCPHANDHRNACTGSNEPGQEGSAYPAAPQQEVKP